MADFIDDEASEASSSDEESQDEVRPRKSQAKSRVVDSSEEEEEDDEAGVEEMKDLINDEEEEEGDDDDESDDESDGKRSHEDSFDEEDLEIAGLKKKKTNYKRIRTAVEDDSDEEVDEGRRIQNELFGPDELLQSDDEDVNKQRPRAQDRDINLAVDDDEDSDSEDNFIVDDDDQPIHRKTKKKGARYADSAMQQAQEIFGVDFDFEDIDDEDDYNEEGYEDEFEDEDGEIRARRRKSTRKPIEDIYEPSELERFHMTDEDQEIRAKDIPERFQLRPKPVTEADDDELEREAEWIFRSAFDLPTISVQERGSEPIAGKRSEVIKPEIQYALKCIRNEKLEVPFIAAYRREYVPSISSNFDDNKDLWTIYRYDEQWCELESRRKKLASNYKAVRDHLAATPEIGRIRPITENDIEKVLNAKDICEFEDCRIHFNLYYLDLFKKIEIASLEKKIQEKKATTQARAEGAEAEGEEEQNEPEETEEEKQCKRLARFKISSGKTQYHKCCDDHIDEFVEKFGLTPEQFGENLRDDYQRNNVVQHQVKPIEEAAAHIRPGLRYYQTPEKILGAASLMFAQQLSSDPLVRQTVRKYYFENAVINVKPTNHGMTTIDENHPCYSLKFLKNKPVKTLLGEQFLHLESAEKAKLLEIKFSIEPTDLGEAKKSETMSPYKESLKALYYSDFSSTVTTEWNKQREFAVTVAMEILLLPTIEKELRKRLRKEAVDKIIKTSCEKLNDWLNVAPYAPAPDFDSDEDFALRNGTRICGFTFAPDGKSPSFAAIVDSEGELIDHVRLPYLNVCKKMEYMSKHEEENHAKDRQKFKEFIIRRKPHVVALAAETIKTKDICGTLAKILDELFKDDGLPLIPIEIVDNDLSNYVVKLKKATDEFPEFPDLLLQAISNARKLNDPLSEYAKLCTPDNDILNLRFHPMQDELTTEKEKEVEKASLLTSLYHTFVTRTNATGVDPNRCIGHPHTLDLVQFIAGLGPRKASHLIRSIKKSSTHGQGNGHLVSRQQLVKELGMTSTIFINCAGFIKLDTDTLSEWFPEDHITPLDSTRIHPQSYGLAKKIASDALDYEEGASDEITANSVEEILDCPEKLDDLDLGAFARELDEVQDQGKKGYTLQSIREEFQCRYKDHRESYKAPSQEEIFAMLTKETPQTFYIGKLVTCTITRFPTKKPSPAELDMANPVKIDLTNLWRCPFCKRSDFEDLSVVWNHFDAGECPGTCFGVNCKLDNGLSGFIHNRNLSDSEVNDPRERVQVGQTIHARVIKINSDKFNCDLTCRTSDLVDEHGKLKPNKDDFYDEASDQVMRSKLAAEGQKKARRPHCKRIIVHPAFENINAKDCEKKLQDKPQGHAIIRPSSYGKDFLNVSWKVADNIFQHIRIREEGKANAFSLGQQLFIDNEQYEDLDEIIARHIQPMASFARDILDYKYCIELPPGVHEVQALELVLLSEKQQLVAQNKMGLPYRFCPSKEHPGRFLLGFQPLDKMRPRIEAITVTPRGIKYRNQYFMSFNKLIKWFKINWNNVETLRLPPGYGSLRQTFPMSQ